MFYNCENNLKNNIKTKLKLKDNSFENLNDIYSSFFPPYNLLSPTRPSGYFSLFEKWNKVI